MFCRTKTDARRRVFNSNHRGHNKQRQEATIHQFLVGNSGGVFGGPRSKIENMPCPADVFPRRLLACLDEPNLSEEDMLSAHLFSGGLAYPGSRLFAVLGRSKHGL